MMKLKLFLVMFGIALTSSLSFGICPRIHLKTFDKKRGFSEIYAYKDDETGMTRFSITINPATFLSHFSHAFPNERAIAHVTLKSINTNDFKGVTVDLARMSDQDPDLRVSFEVPSTDLEHYELEFICSITWGEGDIPVMGGEIHTATLQSYRNAKEAVTETSPIWEELQKQREAMQNIRGFDSSSPTDEQQEKTEQDTPSNR